MRVRFILATVLAAALGSVSVSASARTTASPSFDCAKAKAKVELTICGDPALSAADALMARLFEDAQTSAFGTGLSNEIAVQRKWLKDRSNACTGLKAGEQLPCLREFFDRRNEELAIAALFRSPELALQTLRRVDPNGAPLLEALYLYSNVDQGADWSSAAMSSKRIRLLSLLEPYARRFTEDRDLSFGRDILKDQGIASADDALKSEKAFASFVQVASAYIADGPVPRSMPCGSILRHPGLLDATGPVFGSTLDNFVLDADCDATLPPLPMLDKLIERVWKLWPDCEGTIRFAGYRAFAQSVTSSRVATADEIAAFAKSRDGQRRGSSHQSRRFGEALISSTIDELAHYYEIYRDASQSDARVFAAAAVRQTGVLLIATVLAG